MSSPAMTLPAKGSQPVSVRNRRRQHLRRRFWRRVAALTFYLLAATALYQFWAAPWWYLQSVEVRASSPELQRAVEAELARYPQGLLGRHLLLLHPWRISEQLQRLPQVRLVQVTRHLFPTRLAVVASERLPMARLYLAGSHVARGLDGDGTLLTLGPQRRPATPLRFSAPALPLTPEQRAVVRQAVAAWQARPYPALGTLDIANADRILLGYRNVRWVLGSADGLGRKLTLLPHLLPLTARYRETLEYINVSDPHNPVLKTVTPSASPTASPA